MSKSYAISTKVCKKNLWQDMNYLWSGSVDGFGNVVGWLHRSDVALVGDDEWEFFHHLLIAERLDPVSAGLRKDDVDEKADVVGESAGCEIDGSRL